MIIFFLILIILSSCSSENDFSSFDEKYNSKQLWSITPQSTGFPKLEYLNIETKTWIDTGVKSYCNNCFTYNQYVRTYYLIDTEKNILKSGDGINWNFLTKMPSGGYSDTPIGVFSAGNVVLIQDSNGVHISKDNGQSFPSYRNDGGSSPNNYINLSYFRPGVYWYGTEPNYIYTRDFKNFSSSEAIMMIENNGIWLGKFGTSDDGIFAISFDGISFLNLQDNGCKISYNAIYSKNRFFTAPNNKTYICKSSNGLTYEKISFTSGQSASAKRYLFYNSPYVYFIYGYSSSGSSKNLYRSIDGETWEGVGNPGLPNGSIVIGHAN